MFSKHTFLKQALIFSLSFVMTACALRFTGEPDAADKAAQKPQLDLGEKATQCLSGYPEKISAFLNGRLSEADTNAFWDCATQSLNLFTSKTKSAAGDDSYSPTELQHFVEKYFLGPNEKIPNGLVNEAMVLKKVFVGGSNTRISKDEIKKTLDWIQTFKRESLRIRPYLPFSMDAAVNLTDSQREQLKNGMLAVAGAVGDALSKTVEPYSFTSLSGLLNEFSALYGGDSPSGSKLQDIRRQLPTIALAKALFVSPGREILKPSDWKIVLERGVNSIFFYADSQKNWSYFSESPELLDNAQKFSNQAFHWLQIAIANQPNNQIDFSIFRELLELAGESRIQNFLGRPLKLDTAQKTLETVIVKLLGGAVAKTAFPDAATASGLTRPVLDYLQSEANQLISIQKSLSKFQNLRAGVSLMSDIPASSLEKEISQIISQRPVLFSTNSYEITYSPESTFGEHNMQDLIQINWMRTVTRLIFRGYSRDSARASLLQGITADELHELYLDFWPMGTELRFLDPRTKSAARKRFLETNLFAFKADGNDVLDFGEMMDLLSYLYSSKSFSARIYNKLRPICEDPTLGNDVLYGMPLMTPKCFRSVFPKLIILLTEKNMPAFSRYFATLNEEQQAEATQYLEMAGRFDGLTQDPVEAGDMDGVAVVLHYIETFFARFDTNYSGTINPDKALPAFAVFKPEFKKLVTQQIQSEPSDWQLEAIFTYLLKYGETPSRSGLLWWQARRSSGVGGFEADRLRILQILASLTRQQPAALQKTAAAVK